MPLPSFRQVPALKHFSQGYPGDLDSLTQEMVARAVVLVAKPVRCQESPEVSAFDAEVEIEGRCVTIRVSVGSLLELPQIHLQPWYALGRIPHVVEDSGFVCYLDPEGLLLDRRRPFDLIEQAIRKTVAVLSDGVAGRNRMDFVEEFDNYWSRLSGVETAHSVMNLGGGGS